MNLIPKISNQMEKFEFLDKYAFRIIEEDQANSQKKEKINKFRRTKIVATIGSIKNYEEKRKDPDKQLIDLNGKKRDPAFLTLDYIIGQFYNLGVDVIRINFSHTQDPDEAQKKFKEVKDAILKHEKSGGNGNKPLKRISVLADLPGPKIRFDTKENKDLNKRGEKIPIKIELDQDFDIILDNTPINDPNKEQCVHIDGKPLKEAMENIEQDQYEFKNAKLTKEQNLSSQDLENLRIDQISESNAPINPYSNFMNNIKKNLLESQKVLVFVGEADIVMEVRSEFDPNVPKIPCRIITINKVFEGKKGFTVKGIDFDIPTFTKTDKLILEKLIEKDCENEERVLGFIGLSFAQTADDVLRTKYFIESVLSNQITDKKNIGTEVPSVISKIETQKGWENRRYIIDVTDGIMVARGDLGLQVDIEKIPSIQKRLISLCRKKGKPVITATQMLSSMCESIEPLRAEVSDVFNAIQDGTDAVMMSEETATGKYPFHTIQKMNNIISRAENYYEFYGIIDENKRALKRKERIFKLLKDEGQRIKETQLRITELESILQLIRPGSLNKSQTEFKDWSIRYYTSLEKTLQIQGVLDKFTEAVAELAEDSNMEAIIAATTSGNTAKLISRLRPAVVVIAASHSEFCARKLTASYGVIPICIGSVGTEGEILKKAIDQVKELKSIYELLKNKGIIFTHGTDFEKTGTTDTIRFLTI